MRKCAGGGRAGRIGRRGDRACHGADGRAGNRAWPNLAGLSKDYLFNTLKAYRGGARNNAMMVGIVKDLSDSDAESVADYYASASCK